MLCFNIYNIGNTLKNQEKKRFQKNKKCRVG